MIHFTLHSLHSAIKTFVYRHFTSLNRAPKKTEDIDYDQLVVPDKKNWKNLLAYMGPGFLVCIAYIDPGNFQTDLQSGAQYKYEVTKLAISLLGAMVMPHNLFLHTALVLCRKIPQSVRGIRSVVGKWSLKIFAIALLPSGQSSTITETSACQYVMQGFVDLLLRPWIRNLLTRCLPIVPSLIVPIFGGSSAAGNLIIIASMILSLELPFALIPLLKFTSCRSKMGLYVNSVGKKNWKNLLAYMGPGFLVCIAYIDPGNFQTNLQSGAQFKYGATNKSGAQP